jgi:2-dehydropantoate 2-reductase
MQANGVRLLIEGEERVAKVRCASDPRELGPQDYVFITLKAHQVPGVVDLMQPLLGPDTAVVTGVNGIPYWYFHQHGGEFAGRTLESVDPGARQWNGLGPERAIGCVLYPAAEIIAPGVIKHVYGKKFPIGSRTAPARARDPSGRDDGAGGHGRPGARQHSRRDLAQALGQPLLQPDQRLDACDARHHYVGPGHAGAVAPDDARSEAHRRSFGVHFRVDVERRIDGAGAVGAHKTSMLQDLEAGRAMEIDPLLTVVQEMGRMIGQPTPMIDAVLGLIKQRDRMAQAAPSGAAPMAKAA